jgi:nucleoid-associated protein YgaU
MANRYNKTSIRVDENKNRYYTNTQYPEIPPNVDDVYVLTQAGDRLDNLANNFYQDTSLWWVISRANPDKIRRDGLLLKPGIQIRIPSNIQAILNAFENLNTAE